MSDNERDFERINNTINSVGGCFSWVITIIIFLSVILLLSSCNPFVNKDLRRKNKCNRKLERVTRKCPELLNKDTLIINLDTTIVTREVRVDTLVSTKFDTLEIIKDKFHLKLIKTTDTLIIEGGCDSDTIYVEKIVKVPYDVVKPVQLTVWEQTMNWLGNFWGWLVLLIVLYLAYKIIKKIKE